MSISGDGTCNWTHLGIYFMYFMQIIHKKESITISISKEKFLSKQENYELAADMKIDILALLISDHKHK